MAVQLHLLVAMICATPIWKRPSKKSTIGSPAVGDELFRKLYEEKGSENTLYD